MKQILMTAVAALLLSACADQSSRIIIMANGDIEIDGNKVTVKPGSSHAEQELTTNEKEVIVSNAGSTQNFPIPAQAVYILNVKKDTVAGSFQRTGESASQQVISQQELAVRIDSLNDLIAGRNVSAEKRNFNVPPGQLVKITNNMKARIVGPFMKIPSNLQGGADFELYKFYSGSELREIISRLRKMQDSTLVAPE
jgi:hypothetical protein